MPKSNVNTLTAAKRMAFLLLSGVFQGNQQPTIRGRNGQLLVAAGIESLPVTAESRLNILRFAEVTVAGLAKFPRALRRCVKRAPLLCDGRHLRLRSVLEILRFARRFFIGRR